MGRTSGTERARVGSHCTLGLGLALAVLTAPAAAQVEAVGANTPWRAYLVTGPDLRQGEGGYSLVHRNRQTPFDPAAPGAHQTTVDRQTFSPLAPTDWTTAEFDDFAWPRYRPDDLFDFLGDYGVQPFSGSSWVTSLHLRTRFGIANPALVRDLTLNLRILGGAVVYVNGVEVGRGSMPEGDLHPLTPALPYPAEAYTTPEGAPLPSLSRTEKPSEAWLGRYQARVRSFQVDIPARVLRPGANVLAVEIRRAPLAGPLDKKPWNHAGFHAATLSSASGQGVLPYAAAAQGIRVWSAPPEQQIADAPSETSLIRRSWFWSVITARALPVRGLAAGNPFDPLVPVRMAAPRNGTASGQVVLSGSSGPLPRVAAALDGPLRGPGGASMPVSAFDIRYAAQVPGLHYCDVLQPDPPESARTVPVWLIAQVPAGQTPGWYTGLLRLGAGAASFQVPVQVLVTGLDIPPSRAFQESVVGMTQSPKSVAMHYGVDPWSDRHWQLLEPSLRLLGQVGNDVVNVPVIFSNFPTAGRAGGGRRPSRSTSEVEWDQPMVRWVETPQGLRPDFQILERYLDLYLKHNGPPLGLSFWIWDPPSATELGEAYEGGTRNDSVELGPGRAAEIEIWNPRTGETRRQAAPALLDPGAEAFWRPFFDGVRDLVRRRGWPEKVVMLGLGSDVRPGARTGERVREWAPYARWDLLSHFSGDPPAQNGRLVATGKIEIGVQRWPTLGGVFTAATLERRLGETLEFLQLPTNRWNHQPVSPPLTFRTQPMLWGRIGHLGLDFWMPRRQGPSTTSFFSHVNALSHPGPEGALPTVRFQMFRQGVQDHEIRMALLRASLQLPEAQRTPYRDLLDEFADRIGRSQDFLSQHELAHDWPDYVARVQEAAAEAAGIATDARWAEPPAPGAPAAARPPVPVAPPLPPAAPAATGELRPWRSRDGRTLRARLVEFNGTEVVLDRDDGRRVRFSPALLSDPDQAFLGQVRP